MPPSSQRRNGLPPLVGLVDVDAFCGGPTMAFGSSDNVGAECAVAPIADGPEAHRAAVADLNDSLDRLYEQALRLGHTEAALFIGCAALSVSEVLDTGNR